MGPFHRWVADLWNGKKQLGQNTDRATAVIAIGTTPIFAITGGRILVTMILGDITIGFAAGATTMYLQANPTVGTTTALCTGTDCASYAIGDMLGITGVPTDTLQPAASGIVTGQMIGLVIPVGAIELVSSANNIGSVAWTLKWIPIDTGAAVAAV